MFTRLLRKVLTRPIWWWETGRPYPIRKSVFGMPPRPVDIEAPHTLVICASPSTLDDAGWAAYSLLRGIERPMRLVIVAPSFDPLSEASLRALFPGCRLLVDEDLSKSSAARRLPNVCKLGSYHPMGRKLLAVLALQEESAIIFSDSDMLAFGALPEIQCVIDDGFKAGRFIQDVSFPVEPVTLANAAKMGLHAHERFSCGLMMIPRSSLDFELAEKLLETDETITSWFPDTIVLGMLMAHIGAQALPDSTYIQHTERQFYTERDVDYGYIKVRHFVGPVRHLMYMKGMPLLRAAWARSPQP